MGGDTDRFRMYYFPLPRFRNNKDLVLIIHKDESKKEKSDELRVLVPLGHSVHDCCHHEVLTS